MTRTVLTRIACLAFLAAFLTAMPLVSFGEEQAQPAKAAQEKAKEGPPKEKQGPTDEDVAKGYVIHNEIVVTATGSEKTVFDVPQPSSVIDRKDIAALAPNNISDILPEVPGTDVVGVGANQSRPIIRGLRGQRILLLTDGIRLSNSRRTQDFGEIPALMDVLGLERVEIVRGPASVLYGSEAIGGVINMISRLPDFGLEKSRVSGHLGYRYSSADNQSKMYGNVGGNVGQLVFMLSGSYRNARDYSAPAGTFGKITLADDTPVTDSGVKDRSLNLFLGYRLAGDNDLSFRYESYRAQDGGFGYVDPAAYSPGDPVIQLRYPDQKMSKFSLKYENRSSPFVLADGMTFVVYRASNTRTFDTDIAISFFPGAGMNISSSNFTDVKTWGARLDLTKVVFKKHILTYGFDFFIEDSSNTDISLTEMYFFGPPVIFPANTAPNVPNAFLRSLGFFVQDEIPLFSRSSLVLGVRYQDVLAETKETAGLAEPLMKSEDNTLVGSANFIYGVTDNFNLLLTVGRGFRSPNLPERFFQGMTPDGSGYQIRNTGLKAETSFNLDLGLRYRLRNFIVEATFFRNTLYDGIQIAATGGLFSGEFPEYQNVNIDKLRLQGFEILSQLEFGFGLSLQANFSYVESEDLSNPELPYSDTYGSRFNVNARYTLPGDGFWIEYHVRFQGDQKNIDLGVNPIGSIIPGFTVHSLRAGVTLFKNSGFPQHVGIVLGNMTNRLYSEFSNASFFRPAPKRHIVVSWGTSF